jgi:hypothetical protein
MRRVISGIQIDLDSIDCKKKTAALLDDLA